MSRWFVLSAPLTAAACCVLVIVLSPAALAVPYASGISESGTTVTYFLNEDADSITFNLTGESNIVVTDPNDARLKKGSHTFDKGAATAYDIEVSKSTAVGYTQISDDSLIQSQYFSPRGVAVNQNPDSEHFGNIYVSEGLGGQVTQSGGTRFTLDGIFVMGADQSDIIGQVDDGYIGGIDTSLSSNSPFHITIAPDDTVYIADWADAHSGVWRAPADLGGNGDPGTWPNILANDTCDGSGLCSNHGSIPAVWVEGTGASTKLYTMDEDWEPDPNGGSFPHGRGDILRYDIGTSTNYSGAPVVQVDDDSPSPNGKILNGLMDLVRDEDGTWWVSQYRFTDTQGVPSLSHWADDPNGGAPLWVSGRTDGLSDADFNDDIIVDGTDFLTWQRNTPTIGGAQPGDGDANFDGNIDGDDLLIWENQYGTSLETLNLDVGGRALDLHNGNDLIIVATIQSAGADIIDISNPNNPVLAAIIPASGTIRDVAWDIAGNAYIVSSSSENLRIWSPGGDFIATTGSNGSFSIAELGALAAVPEPNSLLILAMGVICLAGRRFTNEHNSAQ